ncbi:hypothetical protein [Allobacillus saliphilus]|uniref:hypothetical protein n=1 Tax=Allobacillus saliphilus TaxID=2912308 RepID=UPI001BAD517D|nr:hypothetical protein [Allobacillus saliphilus]
MDEHDILLKSHMLYGIDQFIGEPTLWDKGNGTDIERIKSHRCHKGAVGGELSKQTGRPSL